MDRRGQTVSATAFAELTGLSRERLRTWERRFGFPQPVRSGQGPRRYALRDASRVLAVRRAAEGGVPLAHAIANASAADAHETPTVSPAMLASVVTAAPTPIVLLTGPRPLRVTYVNAPLGSLAVGDELERLPWFLGSDLERTLHTLFASSTATLECGHPAWDGSSASERSVAYRLPPEPGEPPTVALVGADRTDEQRARRELGDLRRELAGARSRQERLERWIELTASLAERFQREADDAVLPTVTSTMVRALQASDAAIAVYMTGELALGSSSRGLLGPRMVTVTGYDDLAGLMHTGRTGWLGAGTGAAFGVPPGLHALGVPIVVVGDTLGLLLLVFAERAELDADAHRLLTVVSAGLGFTLLRDRLVASGRGAGPRP